MTNQKNVLILGYGEMGHAMEVLLGARHRLFIWDKFPQPDFKSVALDQVLPQADFVLFCLPVNPHREVLNRVKDNLKPNSLCLSIAKGLDETGATAAQIFQEVLPARAYALLYGPMISEEIREGKAAFAQLGCNDDEAFVRIRDLYHDSQIYLEHTRDITGISWSVILKNVYAMVFGMADELDLGKNMRGYLAVAALNELNRVVRMMGGEDRSPFNLAGLGDLITTATSIDSHHHELGRKLVRGETSDISGEGIHTLAMINKHGLFDTAALPLMHLIESVVKNPQRVDLQLKAHLSGAFSS
jgi:glycerol-3-phosphate dehydrogenase (NAD(P)+)